MYAGQCGLRLSLDPVDPAPAADQSAKSIIYLTPMFSNQIALPVGNGTWSLFSMPASSGYTVTGLTSSTNYDLGLSVNTTTGAFTFSVNVWTNDTTPPTRTRQDGVLCTATNTILLGSFRAVSATTAQDTAGSRWLSNVYNPIKRRLYAYDSTTTRTTSSTSWVTDNANTTDGQGRFSYTQAIANYPVFVRQAVQSSMSGGAGTSQSGLGVNSTTVVTSPISTTIGSTGWSAGLYCSVGIPSTIGITYVQRLIATTTNTMGVSNLGTYTEGEIWN